MNDNGREFVDSNVLIYAHDVSAGQKRDTARALVARLWKERCGCLSVQVLQEFAVNATRKIPKPLSIRQVQEVIAVLNNWNVHSPAPVEVINALDRQSQYQISFWDAMILGSAERMDCQVVWSEDLNAGQLYNGIEVRNPFSSSA